MGAGAPGPRRDRPHEVADLRSGRGLRPVRRGLGAAAQRRAVGPGGPGGGPARPRVAAPAGHRARRDDAAPLPARAAAGLRRGRRRRRPRDRRPAQRGDGAAPDHARASPTTTPPTSTSTSRPRPPRSPSCSSGSRCSAWRRWSATSAPPGSASAPRRTCTNVYVDTSPNHSRRYCSDRCSSRANVAAYRASSGRRRARRPRSRSGSRPSTAHERSSRMVAGDDLNQRPKLAR